MLKICLANLDSYLVSMFCDIFFRYLRTSLFRASWASSLNIPIGSRATEITSDPWMSTLWTLVGIGYQLYSLTYKRAVSMAYVSNASALTAGPHDNTFRIVAHLDIRTSSIPVISAERVVFSKNFRKVLVRVACLSVLSVDKFSH